MRFWRSHPALYFGFCLYVGVSLGVGVTPWVSLLLVCGWAGWRWSAVGVCVIIVALLWVTAMYRLPECPQEGLEGQAVFVVDHLSIRHTFFGRTQYLRGQLREFWVENECVGRRIPVSMYLSLKQKGPEVGSGYHLRGKLKRSELGQFTLKVARNVEWKPLGRSRWISRIRAWAREGLKGRLDHRLGSGPATQLLVGLATGEFSDPELLLAFGRLGLQHLMAISGFHFSIIAGVLAVGLRIWLSPRSVALVLALLLSSYFLFIGPAPSVLRAWTMALVGCLALLTGRGPAPLNSLGIALLVVLLYDPMAVCSLGFQFSFACTAALLAFCDPIQQLLGSGPLRRGAAAILAVNLAAAPLTLTYFHRLPLIGLVMNLVFPVLISGLMLILGLALVLEGWIPVLGGASFFVARKLADAVLWAAREMPAFFDFTWRMHGVPSSALAILGVGLVACAVWFPELYPWVDGQARTAPLHRRRSLPEGSSTT